jgi:hypothetical protein
LNISANIRKNWNRYKVCLLGPGEVVWEKNQRWKIWWHCPFKHTTPNIFQFSWTLIVLTLEAFEVTLDIFQQ